MGLPSSLRVPISWTEVAKDLLAVIRDQLHQIGQNNNGGLLTLGLIGTIRDFDALVIPGGYAPDRMRMRHAIVDLVRDAIVRALLRVRSTPPASPDDVLQPRPR